MNAIERRYRWLLRVYPKAYREVRAEEMVATLLESSRPDQTLPRLAEGRDMLIGSLRVRGRGSVTRPGELWTEACQIAALVLLGLVTASSLGWLRAHGQTFDFSWSFILVLGWQLLLLLALVAGRRTLALVAMIGGLIAIGLDAVQLLRADLPGNWIVVATLPYAAILTFAGLGLRNGRHHSIGWLALPIVSFFVAEPFLVVAGLIAIGLTGLVLFGVDPRWTAAAAVLAGTVAIHVGLIVAASGADIATRQKALAIGSAIGLALFLGILATVGRRRLLRT